MDLDHIVVHWDEQDNIEDIKSTLLAAGIPFKPEWGKKAKGFKISNIWIGTQYFEIVQLFSRDNLWVPRWSQRYFNGERGSFCGFLRVDENGDLDALYQRLQARGIKVTEPERTSFKWFFGLFKKTMPWRYILTECIPGSLLELGFIQYDRGALDKFIAYMIPNASEHGIQGMDKLRLYSHQYREAMDYLKRLESILETGLPIEFRERLSGGMAQVEVKLNRTTASITGKPVHFADISLMP